MVKLQNQDPVSLTLASAAYFTAQLQSTWRANLKLPAQDINSIVVCGMGGSALGADMLRTALAQQLTKPLTIVNDYQLPAWVNQRTLVVCASYSGNTRETIACFKQAVKQRCRVAVITRGGRLLRLAKKLKAVIKIDDRILNPSRQPRLGLGFQLGALLRILVASQALNRRLAEASVQQLKPVPVVGSGVVAPLIGKMVIVLGVGSLQGAAHAIANQFNENAKVMAAPFGLPEAAHHLLEGLGQRLPLAVILLIPNQLPNDLRRQVQATVMVLKKQGWPVISWRPLTGASPLVAALAAGQWGAYASLAVAQKNKVNPLAVPWVDFLKKKLK